MGFLDNYGTGAQSFVDNYLKVSQFDQQRQLEQQRLTQQKAYQDAHLQLLQNEQGNKQSPLLTSMITAAQNGTLGPQGLAILDKLGYGGVFTTKPDKPELMPTVGPDGKPIMGPKVVGAAVYEKPDKPDLMPTVGPDGKPIMGPKVAGASVYEKPENRETWSEPYEMNVGGKKGLVQKSSHGQIRPLLEDRSTTTTVNMQNPSTEEVEVVAQLLADGKITMNDISKRGGVKQQAAILKRASELNPSIDPRADQAGTQAFAGSMAFLQKQLGAMGSFVKNMDYQVKRVEELSKELNTFDSRILNLPLRAVRGKITGSPLQAKYDMYITEIENEIGKLATGSSASVSELSVGAQEKWEKIHDKNLSVKDMLSLLKETSKAGKMRMQSVQEQLKETQTQMRGRGQRSETPAPPSTSKIPTPQAIDRLKRNPKEAALFDMTFGKGSSRQYLGGM